MCTIRIKPTTSTTSSTTRGKQKDIRRQLNGNGDDFLTVRFFSFFFQFLCTWKLRSIKNRKLSEYNGISQYHRKQLILILSFGVVRHTALYFRTKKKLNVYLEIHLTLSDTPHNIYPNINDMELRSHLWFIYLFRILSMWIFVDSVSIESPKIRIHWN